MKKSISIILLFVFLFNTVGYVIAFRMIQSTVKEEIRFELWKSNAPEQLAILVIPNSELKNIQWLDEGKEIRYKGHMYDIVSMRKTVAGIAFCCFDDSREKGLVETFEQYVESNSPVDSFLEEEDEEEEEKDSKKKILNHITKLYILSSHSTGFILQSSPNKFYRAEWFYTSTTREAKGFPPENFSYSI